MASLPQLPHPSKIADTLRYFDKYDYPLTAEELHQYLSSRPSPAAGEGNVRGEVEKTGEFFHLKDRSKIVVLRRQRAKISLKKWLIAQEIGEKLKKFSYIQAVFVTGSLAMNNAKQSDDIDLMIVTSANTLWITRFFVNIYLSSARRYPGQKQVANVVCINLWLDENNLAITPHNLYVAHEIVQAKILWDRSNISQKFLSANVWVKEFLPNAFRRQNVEYRMQNTFFGPLYILNSIFYILQLLYMKPRMTTERVAPGFAFFHPNRS